MKLKISQRKSDQSTPYAQNRRKIQPITTGDKITTYVTQQEHILVQKNKLQAKSTEMNIFKKCSELTFYTQKIELNNNTIRKAEKKRDLWVFFCFFFFCCKDKQTQCFLMFKIASKK